MSDNLTDAQRASIAHHVREVAAEVRYGHLVRDALVSIERIERKRIARGTEQPTASAYTDRDLAWFRRSLAS
jgi:hypothetical protein